MTGRDDCLNELRGLVRRANRDDLAAAQDCLIRYAFGGDGAGRGEDAFDGLIAGLTHDDRTGSRSHEQHAFHLALLAMIERTRAAAKARSGEVPAASRAPRP